MGRRPPFRSFGENYYTYQILIDLDVPDTMAVRTEPHPCFYADPNDETPLAVPALLRTSWWPMISFVVFKMPPEGRTPACCDDRSAIFRSAKVEAAVWNLIKIGERTRFQMSCTAYFIIEGAWAQDGQGAVGNQSPGEIWDWGAMPLV